MGELIKTVYISKSFDPTKNLAFEEWLLQQCEGNEVILYLWQNKSTVVIGRNQSPYKECDLKKIKEDGVSLVRRLSGGGAVYHDMGNLNFTFIANEKNYNVKRQLEIILRALKHFNIEANFSGRNDLVIHHKKFSGNAFAEKDGNYYHHGTLMVDVVKSDLMKYLTPSKVKVESKGIDSISSRVINLNECCETITVEGLKDALIQVFDETYQGSLVIKDIEEETLKQKQKHEKISIQNEHDMKYLLEKYKSFDWRFGESPKNTLSLTEKFSWGVLNIEMTVVDGFIKGANVFTDALEDIDCKAIGQSLIGKKANSNQCRTVITPYINDQGVRDDFLGMFNQIMGI